MDPVIQEIQCNLQVIPRLRLILEIQFPGAFSHVVLFSVSSIISSEQTFDELRKFISKMILAIRVTKNQPLLDHYLDTKLSMKPCLLFSIYDEFTLHENKTFISNIDYLKILFISLYHHFFFTQHPYCYLIIMHTCFAFAICKQES